MRFTFCEDCRLCRSVERLIFPAGSSVRAKGAFVALFRYLAESGFQNGLETPLRHQQPVGSHSVKTFSLTVFFSC